MATTTYGERLAWLSYSLVQSYDPGDRMFTQQGLPFSKHQTGFQWLFGHPKQPDTNQGVVELGVAVDCRRLTLLKLRKPELLLCKHRYQAARVLFAFDT